MLSEVYNFVILYGCEILTLREEDRLWSLKTRCWEKYFDLGKRKVMRRMNKQYIMRSFIICTFHQIFW